MASTVLTRTPSGAGNQKKWTYSIWFKRAVDNQESALFCVGDNPSSNMCMLRFDPDVLNFYSNNSNAGRFTTKRKFRDTNAWYHVVVAYDSANATSDDRLKFYVNGERTATSDMTGVSAVAQDTDSKVNTTTKIYIGERPDGNNHFDGIMSHIHFCDGYAYAASDFGETDSTTGEWKIKTNPSVTYGTNGFFILKDGNSVTDQSGNSNNFAVEAGNLTNTEDCPSNIFATFNYNANNANAILSQGGTTVSHSSTSWKRALSNLGATSGKWYWEVKRNNSNTPFYKFGMIEETGQYANMPAHEHHADNAYGWAWYVNGGNIELRTAQAVISGYSQSDLGNTSMGNGDIICVALDLDNGRLHARKNDGSWLKSGDPAAGTGGYAIANWSAGKLYIPACSVYQNATCEHNFGNGYFGTTAVSSAGTNASNIGIFEYDVPTGFTALSTKGLNE